MTILAALPTVAATPSRIRELAPARALHIAGRMTINIKMMLLSAVLAAGCSKKGSTCEDVYDHTMSHVPAEQQSKMEGKKEDALAKCEKLSPEARQCAMDASSMEDLMKCPRK